MNAAMQEEFNQWWNDYPRKVGRLAAMKAYQKARKLASAKELREGVGRYIANKPSYADFCHATTFLSQGRWMDDYDMSAKPAASVSPKEVVRNFMEMNGHFSIECERIHGGTCKSGNEHYDRRDAERAAQAS